MPAGQFYEAVISGVIGSDQDFSIVLTYACTEQGADGGGADDLANVLESDLVPLLTAAMATNKSITNIFVQNLSATSEWHAGTISEAGTLSGTPLPPVLAVGFRSPKQNPGINRSRHNLPLGVTAWITSGGSIDILLADAVLYPLQQQLGLPLVTAGDSEFTPIIVTKNYVDGEFSSATYRATVTGQWSVNAWPTTIKTRQSYLWYVIDEPA